METIQASTLLIKDTLVLHLNSQGSSAIVLNGDYKSKLFYDLRNYLDFENDDSIEYVTCSMPYAVITNSNYIVNDYNNQMTITIIVSFVLTYTFPFTLAHGNYTKTSWITYINSLFSDPITFPNQYFILTGDSVTNKFTISVTAAFTGTYGSAYWGMIAPTTCDYIFGFSTSFLTDAPSFTMPRCFNFLPIPRFLFHANILSNGLTISNGSSSSLGSSINSSDILAAIPNVAKLNSQIIYENNSSEFMVKTQVNMSGLEIRITDDDNRLINFNGISCYYDLKFNIYRRAIKKPQKFNALVKTIQETVTNKNDYIILEE